MLGCRIVKLGWKEFMSAVTIKVGRFDLLGLCDVVERFKVTCADVFLSVRR
jgi:hypothetical protein